jgi:hypothetical protein
MSFDFACPWCGCDMKVQGSEHGTWRFRIPCELCNRDAVVTWDGGLVVARVPTERLSRADDDTVRIRVARSA